MTKADREIVFNKYGGRCAYCGCELQKGWHLDHKEPVSRIYETVLMDKIKKDWQGNDFVAKEYVTKYKGMTNPHLDTIENALPACAKCNINKHGDSVEGFRSSIATYLHSLNKRIVQYQMGKKYRLIVETGIEVKFYFEQFENKEP